jgi:hypothetical protein
LSLVDGEGQGGRFHVFMADWPEKSEVCAVLGLGAGVSVYHKTDILIF